MCVSLHVLKWTLLILTCCNIDVGYLDEVIDSNMLSHVAQTSSQSIQIIDIWDVQLHSNQVFINQERSCREIEKTCEY